MTDGDQLAAMATDIRTILVEQGRQAERVGAIERNVKETRDDIRTMVTTTLHQLEAKVNTLEGRPLYTPLSQAAQTDIDLWFSRLRTIWTVWSFGMWLVPIAFVVLATFIGVLTYMNK